MISTIIESACRSLLVALAVWAGLRIFRVRNVVAQKAAWGLVLASAVLMPLLLPLASRFQILPAGAAVVLPADPQTLLEELQARIRVRGSSLRNPSPAIAPIPQATSPHVEEQDTPIAADTSAPIAALPAEPSSFNAAPLQSSSPPPVRAKAISPSILAVWTYLLVASLLLARLICGLVGALYIWSSAKPIESLFTGKLRVRASRKIASPVTIGSAIVLPADYSTWESEKLRVVLAHERSHIRQGDFYLQLFAELYSALVWFSPLGWWLKNKLSDLAEMISDRAGLTEAASRSSYAQVLLQFAAAPRPTPIGVAMARTGTLSRRIERLLNDSAFRQAFAGPRRTLAAVLLVPLALLASTAFIRVHAAAQTSQQPDAQPASLPPADAEIPNATPQADAPPAPAQAETAPQSPSSPEAAPAPPSSPLIVLAPKDAPLAPAPPVILSLQAPVSVVGPDQPPIVLAMPKAPLVPMELMDAVALSNKINSAIASAQSFATTTGEGFVYRFSSNGDSYALISGDSSENMNFSGEIHTGEIDKARKLAHGDFLWFKHDGKDYVVDDPAVITKIEALYQEMKELGKQQEELGKQQEELGKQQETLEHQREPINVPVPDLSKEMADLNAAMAKIQAQVGKTVNAQALADVQAKLAEVQAKLGAADAEMYAHMGDFGAQQGKFGAMQGKLGAEQGRLGARQGRLAAEADQKIRSTIDESLHDGKARPVD
jgi:beta-lactamase regulating signal transducer with metallopeptidase domain